MPSKNIVFNFNKKRKYSIKKYKKKNYLYNLKIIYFFKWVCQYLMLYMETHNIIMLITVKFEQTHVFS